MQNSLNTTFKDAVVPVAALLTSIWCVLQIVSWVGQRTKDSASKEFFISTCLTIAAIVLPIAGTVAFAVFSSRKLSVLLYFLSALTVSTQYLRDSGPATRFETLILVVSWSVTVGIILLSIVDRIIGIMERTLNLVSKS